MVVDDPFRRPSVVTRGTTTLSNLTVTTRANASDKQVELGPNLHPPRRLLAPLGARRLCSWGT